MVHISEPDVRQDVDEYVVSATVSQEGKKDELWFRLPGSAKPSASGGADALFVVGLVLAMATDRVLQLDAPVSPRLLANSSTAQEILTLWYPKKLGRTKLQVASREPEARPVADGSVACFTGGVDSFYSLTTNEASVRRLLYVHGLDVPLGRADLRAEKSHHLGDIASVAGKELFEPSTNVRKFLNPVAEWGTISHGPALASIGHLLGNQHNRFVIPASHTYADLYPWGSHPLLDPLWSSELVEVVHDGAGATRVEKTRTIAFNDSARKHLHVCWQKSGEYNCGRCEKCLRTKIALHLTGVLNDFVTFDNDIPEAAVRKLPIRNASDRSFVVENLAYARAQGDTTLASALQDALKNYEGRGATATPPTLERRLIELEKSSVKTQKSLSQLQGLWPIRAWTRFARWRRRGR